MIKIMHIVSNMDAGGIETLLMNIFKSIDKKNFKFYFLYTREGDSFYDDIILKLGGEIIRIPHINKCGLKKFKRNMCQVFKEIKPDIVHSHMNTWSGLFLKIARQANITIRIAHSHSIKNEFAKFSDILKNIYKYYNKIFINKYATLRLACSVDAGRWLFNKKSFIVLNNGIEVNKFLYNDDYRKKHRYALNIDSNNIVYGCVARFNDQKNHNLIIDIFNEIQKNNKSSILILVGEGPLKKNIESKVERLDISDSVKYLGVRSDVNELYSSFDYFILPSKNEGFGIVCLESQASGLPTIISEKFPKEIDVIPSLVFRYSLKNDVKYWVSHIKEIGLNLDRKKVNNDILDFDIIKSTNKLEKIYYSLMEGL